MVSHYSIFIQWSEEDGSYIVSFPEFPTAHTHGISYEEAARNGREVLDLLIQTYAREGRPLPAPHSVSHVPA